MVLACKSPLLAFGWFCAPYSFTLNMLTVTFAETSVNLFSKWPNVESRFSQPMEIAAAQRPELAILLGIIKPYLRNCNAMHTK